MDHVGRVIRIDKHGLGFIEATGGQYAFSFDKLAGYRGQEPRELGLVEGCVVRFSVDGGMIRDIVITDAAGRIKKSA